MVAAALLAWFADQFPGRRAGDRCRCPLLVLGTLSPLVLAIAFLVAVSLYVIGFVEFGSR